MFKLINWELLRNPANWVIVWTMIAFALIVLSIGNQVSVPSLSEI